MVEARQGVSELDLADAETRRIGVGHDFLWLGRFGALITGIGIIVISRPAVKGTDTLLQVVMDESGLTSNEPEYYRRRNEPIPDAVIEDQESRKAVGILGPLLTLTGTVIWGFADLLNFAVGFRR